MDGHQRSRTLMSAALTMAERGGYVFPLRVGSKVPAVRGWENLATRHTGWITDWWTRAPYNVGVATGPSGLVVIDLDAASAAEPHGRQTLGRLAREAGESIPRSTFTVVTAGGGQHLYFRAPADSAFTNTAGRLGPHVDTRARGGYVVGAGSIVPAGRYRLVEAARPLPLPTWLGEALKRPPPPVVPTGFGSGPHTAYVAAALLSEQRRVATAAVGRRNSTLFTAAARLGRFVDAGLLGEGEIVDALTTACRSHLGSESFDLPDVERTIASGLRTGRRALAVPEPRPGAASVVR